MQQLLIKNIKELIQVEETPKEATDEEEEPDCD